MDEGSDYKVCVAGDNVFPLTIIGIIFAIFAFIQLPISVSFHLVQHFRLPRHRLLFASASNETVYMFFVAPRAETRTDAGVDMYRPACHPELLAALSVNHPRVDTK
jgi:hypothetical protein